MFEPDENGIYAVVEASQPRRWFAYGVLVSLGCLLLYTSITHPPAIHWLIFLLTLGGAILFLAERLRHATARAVALTETELRDSSGVLLARVEDIARVSSGTFALKPAQGFTLVLKTRKPRAWAPGLWWRMGRRIGVGGVTSSGQAKFMAERINLMLRKP